MKNLKNKTRQEIISHCVLVSSHVVGKNCFDWVDVTYKTMCDLGIASPIDGYYGDPKNTDWKEYERWCKIQTIKEGR